MWSVELSNGSVSDLAKIRKLFAVSLRILA